MRLSDGGVAGCGPFSATGRGLAVIVRVQGPNSSYSPAGGVAQPWGTWIKAALDAGADGVIVVPPANISANHCLLCFGLELRTVLNADQ